MSTEILAVDPERPDPAAIARAAAVLLRGGLVAFPTETVYGLGALADDAAAVARIFAAKERPAHNPLISHVPGAAEARAVAGGWPEAAARLAAAFWPGPLTLVVPRGPRIPPLVSAGLDSMAVRAPQHPVARALLLAVGRPVAAPSANPSTQLSPTRAEHVAKGLAGRVELILDAGPCALGIESTVVDTARVPPVILRPGSLSHAELARLVPDLLPVGAAAHAGPAASPGMDRKHYAPRATLEVVPREALSAALRAAPGPVGLVTRGAPLACPPAVLQRVLPDAPGPYAAALFATLHALDDAGCRAIVLEAPPASEAWEAVRDRLARASAR